MGGAEAPYGAIMPAAWPTPLLWAGIFLSAVTLGWAILLTSRGNSPIPVVAWVGGLLCVFVEPLSDALCLAWHPVIGQSTAFVAFGVHVPWHIVSFYAPYYFIPAGLTMTWRRAGALTARRFWSTFAVMVFLALVWEAAPLEAGVWIYYGPQPLTLFHMPVWFTFVNATCLLSAALVTAYLDARGTEAKTLGLALIAPPCVQAAVTAGCGWPIADALHSAAPAPLIWITSFIVMGLCIIVSRAGFNALAR
jgi:hypothetical protein